MRFVEVDRDDPRVLGLRSAMADEMSRLYGRPRHSAAGEAIDPESIVSTLVVLDDADEPVATVALRRLGDDVEVKRMYVLPEARGHGLAGDLLTAMEQRAAELGSPRVLLHTGLRQTPAVALYRRRGYDEIPVFEPYLEVPESICFARPVAALAPPAERG